MPLKELPKAKTLKELLGQTITLAEDIKPMPRDDGKMSYLGKLLPSGEAVWIPQHVIAQMDGTIAGTYVVTSFTSKTWKTMGYGLKNVHPK